MSLLSYLTPNLSPMRYRCGCKKGKTPAAPKPDDKNGS